MESDWWRPVSGGIEIRVRVVPGARRSDIVGISDGRLRIKVAAAPIDGRANDELCRVVARWCGVRPSAVTIVRGETSRAKDVVVHGPSEPPKSPTL